MRSLLLLLLALGSGAHAAAIAVRAPATTAPRLDGRCGANFAWAACSAGSCCSQYGYCGSTSAHCSTLVNCQLQCTDGAGTGERYAAAAAVTTTTTTTTMKFSSSSSSSSKTLSTLVSSFTSKVSSSSTSSSAAATVAAAAGARAVFAHYMIGGMTPDEATQDIQQAVAMGLDAFALNVASTDSWALNSISYLFAAAQAANFKMFFSFDMNNLQSPSQFIPLLQKYYSNSAHYKYNGLPFVSTFYGGKLTFGSSSPNAGWQKNLKDVMTTAGQPIYFVPAFNDAATTPSTFYSSFPVVDGQFNWDGSWPYASQGMVNVSSADDQVYISKAKAAGKTFMMGISPLQFKHMDSNNNWFRRGGLGLALRVPQILAAQPDFVEIQTWNDAGEAHYIGPIWPEAISSTSIPAYTDGYDHFGWQQLLMPFMAAFKKGATTASGVVPTNGKSVQGVFWHSTLLSTASCSGDSMGKPAGSNLIQDVVEVAVSVASGVSGAKVNVYSNGKLIGSYGLTTGLNAFEVPGLAAGIVKVDVLDSAGKTLMTGTGSKAVKSDASYCNYNPQVVPLA